MCRKNSLSGRSSSVLSWPYRPFVWTEFLSTLVTVLAICLDGVPLYSCDRIGHLSGRSSSVLLWPYRPFVPAPGHRSIMIGIVCYLAPSIVFVKTWILCCFSYLVAFITFVCLYPSQYCGTNRGVWLVTPSSLIPILQCSSGACCNCKCWHCIVLCLYSTVPLHVM